MAKKANGSARQNQKMAISDMATRVHQKAHRYFFRLFALHAHTLVLISAAKRQALDYSLKGHAIGNASYLGRYERR